MKELFDLDSPAGQFRAIALAYLLVVGLRCTGFDFLREDHTLLLGALLTLLRGHIGVKG